MLVSRAVTVKSRVTPALKAQLGSEMQKAIRDTEAEIERVSAECEGLRALGRAGEATALDKKIQDLSARRDALSAKMKDIAKLQEGQEVTRGQIQGFCHVKVGDMWPSLQSCDIVLEDGKVVAIREGSAITLDVKADDRSKGV